MLPHICGSRSIRKPNGDFFFSNENLIGKPNGCFPIFVVQEVKGNPMDTYFFSNENLINPMDASPHSYSG